MEKQEILDEELTEVSGGGISLIITSKQAEALTYAGLIVDGKIDPANIDEIKKFLGKHFDTDSLQIKIY